MSKRNSDWYIPPDLLFCLMPMFAITCTMMGYTLIARLMTHDIRSLYHFGLGAGVLGIILLFLARFPLYRQRKFWTFGPKQLDLAHRRLYFLAYIFVAASLLLFIVIGLRD